MTANKRTEGILGSSIPKDAHNPTTAPKNVAETYPKATPKTQDTDELESKLLNLFQRMSVCAATHRSEDAEWIEGQCVTPTTAAKKALALLESQKQQLLERVEREVIGEDEFSDGKSETGDDVIANMLRYQQRVALKHLKEGQ